jgi:hypothetical protein
LAGGGGSTAGADTVAQAHQALLRQHDLQFDFAPVRQTETPDWLKRLLDWIGHGMVALGPAFKIIFWAGLAFAAAALLYFVVREFARMRGWGLRKRPAKPADLDVDWRPAAGRARTLLADADRLAAEGRFDEAVHQLLFRSVEDIDERWPNLVRPALTSRDIAAHAGLPETARMTFGGLAAVVERSFFGGAQVSAADFAACRDAYAAFALAGRP